MPTFPQISVRIPDSVLTHLPAPVQSFVDRHHDKLGYVLLGLGAVVALRLYGAGGKASKTDLKRDLTGKVAIITGGNGGIGYETALQLAKQNATVCIAARPSKKTTDAVARIRQKTNNAHVFAEDLDVSSLKSVRAFADRWRKSGSKIHWLINNAGVMAIPKHTVTAEGFETQMATNHFGHFLLTNLLLDIITSSGQARIINVSSTGHRFGKIDFNDLNNEKAYTPWKVYGDTKLANMHAIPEE
ncbi:hypothetical protein HDV00_009149 [Rhizophlyctis rosea]|nr:hypothetical protein HDV00_009149 [Rhizophlyctis rosea]